MVDLTPFRHGIAAAMRSDRESVSNSPRINALNALIKAGAHIDELIIDDLIRIKGERCRGSEKDFWYIYREIHGDKTIGILNYGYWKDSSSLRWCSVSEHQLTPAELLRFRAAREEMQAKYRDAERLKHEAVAKEAQSIWDRANPVESHPYLIAKNVKAHGLKVANDGRLVVPLRSMDGTIKSLQFIDGIGNKQFLSGGRVKGCYHALDGIEEILCICEGYATGASIHEATGHSVIVAFNSGNLEQVASSIREQNARSKIIVCADNDFKHPVNIGLKKAEEAAALIGASLAIPEFPVGSKGTDFNDLQKELGNEAVRKTINQAIHSTDKTTGNFAFIPVSALIDNIRPPRWLISQYLEEHCLACIFGASGTGKSFISIDMACCIATGANFHGLKVNQGAVFYIAGEGQNGLARRFKAWEINNVSLKDAPLYISENPARLCNAASAMDVANAVRNLVNATKQKPSVIFVDTLARNFGEGDENSTKDMSAFITNIDSMKNEWEASVVIVHHTGLADAGRARGSVALKCAMDHEYKVSKSGTRISFCAEKTKESESPTPLNFELISIPVPHSEGNIPLKGAALKAAKPLQNRGKLTEQEKRGLEILENCINEKGQLRKEFPSEKSVSIEEFREKLKEGSLTNSDKREAVQKAIQRIIKALQDKGVARVIDGFILLADKPDNQGQTEY